MKYQMTFLLALSLTLAFGQQTSPHTLIQAWEKSWNTYDLNAVTELFVNDSSVTYFSSERPGLIRGMDSLVTHHRSFGFVPGGKKSENRLWLTETRYLAGAVTATWHFQRPGGEEQRGPVTFILMRQPTGYRIAHAHFSNDPKGK